MTPVRERITLPEWGRRPLDWPREDVEQLLAASHGALRLEQTARLRVPHLVAGSTVGTISTPRADVVIRPKAGFRNLLYLLGASADDIDWWQETVDYATVPELLPAVLDFFAVSLRRGLQRGLVRSYRREEEPLPTLRGRIDIGQIIRDRGRVHPVPCVYDDFTADIDLNRHLRAAVRAGLRWPGVPSSTRQRLRGELLRFDGVADHRPPQSKIDRHVWTRLDAHYETPARLASLILGRGALQDSFGGARSSTFLIDMNLLFEDFVIVELRRRLRGVAEVVAQTNRRLDRGDQVKMHPDLELQRGREVLYVGDVKYKLADTGQARNSDYYQLLAYTTSLGLDEGVLLYCLTDGGDPDHEIVVRGSNKRLRTYRLDVTGSLEELGAMLDALAEHLIERVSASGLTQV